MYSPNQRTCSAGMSNRLNCALFSSEPSHTGSLVTSIAFVLPISASLAPHFTITYGSGWSAPPSGGTSPVAELTITVHAHGRPDLPLADT